MAAYKALVSFSGRVSAARGSVVEIADPAIAADLLRAKYIEDIEQPEPEQPKRRGRPKKVETE